MTCTTFLSDQDYKKITGIEIIDEWLPEAQKVLKKRIAVESYTFKQKKLFFFKSNITLYTALIDLGHGQAQIVNFAPRIGSTWSINHYVPAEEISSWLMGVVAGGYANESTNRIK